MVCGLLVSHRYLQRTQYKVCSAVYWWTTSGPFTPPPLFAGLIFLHHNLTENDVPLLLYLSTVKKDYPYMLSGIGYLRKYLPYLPLISKHVDMWIGREGCVVFKSVRVFFCVSCLFGWLRNALCCGQQD